MRATPSVEVEGGLASPDPFDRLRMLDGTASHFAAQTAAAYEARAEEIIRLRAAGHTEAAIGRALGLTRGAVHLIVRRYDERSSR